MRLLFHSSCCNHAAAVTVHDGCLSRCAHQCMGGAVCRFLTGSAQALGCDMQIDIFSLGILLREMVTGEIPQPYQMREQLGVLTPGHSCSPDVIELIRECCASDPTQRPSAEHAHDRLTAR